MPIASTTKKKSNLFVISQRAIVRVLQLMFSVSSLNLRWSGALFWHFFCIVVCFLHHHRHRRLFRRRRKVVLHRIFFVPIILSFFQFRLPFFVFYFLPLYI